MTYESLEISAYSGHPKELFEFVVSGETYRYTSYQADITYNGFTYTAIPIKRSRVQQTNDMPKSEVEIRVPRDNEMVGELVGGMPEAPISVAIYRGQGSNWIVFWKGRAMGRTYEGDEAIFKCIPTFSSLKRIGIRRRYQANCPYTLYDGHSCKVLRTSFEYTGVINLIDGVEITNSISGAYADDYFTGGWFSNGINVERMIYNHTGSVLRLSRAIPSMSVGDNIYIYPGCDRTLATCNDKFSNVLNYGGLPAMPARNPFGPGGIMPNVGSAVRSG
jgi:uncharacterized phage protein (TIGR02218 family)